MKSAIKTGEREQTLNGGTIYDLVLNGNIWQNMIISFEYWLLSTVLEKKTEIIKIKKIRYKKKQKQDCVL